MIRSIVRSATAASLAVVLAFALAGCGDDEPAAAGTPTSAPSDTQSPEPEPTPTPEPTDDAGTGTGTETPADTSPDASGTAPDTTEGAIARFEEYLHALGNKDVPTLCEIAAPAAKIAEDEGFGPCETTFAMVVEMPSPEQLVALQTATVDPALVDAGTPGRVTVPLEAVVASATFADEELGDNTLAYQDGNWYIVE